MHIRFSLLLILCICLLTNIQTDAQSILRRKRQHTPVAPDFNLPVIPLADLGVTIESLAVPAYIKAHKLRCLSLSASQLYVETGKSPVDSAIIFDYNYSGALTACRMKCDSGYCYFVKRTYLDSGRKMEQVIRQNSPNRHDSVRANFRWQRKDGYVYVSYYDSSFLESYKNVYPVPERFVLKHVPASKRGIRDSRWHPIMSDYHNYMMQFPSFYNWHLVYHYNKRLQLTEELDSSWEYEGDKPGLAQRITYRYDHMGRLKEKMVIYGHDTESVYKYHKGLLISLRIGKYGVEYFYKRNRLPDYCIVHYEQDAYCIRYTALQWQ